MRRSISLWIFQKIEMWVNSKFSPTLSLIGPLTITEIYYRTDKTESQSSSKIWFKEPEPFGYWLWENHKNTLPNIIPFLTSNIISVPHFGGSKVMRFISILHPFLGHTVRSETCTPIWKFLLKNECKILMNLIFWSTRNRTNVKCHDGIELTKYQCK